MQCDPVVIERAVREVTGTQFVMLLCWVFGTFLVLYLTLFFFIMGVTGDFKKIKVKLGVGDKTQ